MKIRRDRKGFTLIELLIVIAIIGILAAIALPAYTGYTGRAKVAGVVHSMGAIKTALSAYFVENGASARVRLMWPTIKNNLGIDIATQYATYGTDANGVITATIQNVNADTNGQTHHAHAGRNLQDLGLEQEQCLHRTCQKASY